MPVARVFISLEVNTARTANCRFFPISPVRTTKKSIGKIGYGNFPGAATVRVVTSEQMRQADQATVADGVASIALMENAAHRVAEVLAREFAPLGEQKIVVL